MIAELLVISGNGLKANAFGDPAVQGPGHVSGCSARYKCEYSPVLLVLYSCSALVLYVAFVTSSVGDG